MGTASRRPGCSILCPAHADTLGKLQSNNRQHPLNTDLAKKPQECLEYIVVHEMVHLLEPTHNDRFVALMDRYLPHWQHQRQMLNRLPVRHEDGRI